MDKVNLRAKLKNERSALNKKYILNKSLIISKKIKNIVKKQDKIASYSPFNNEVNPNLYLYSAYFPKVKRDSMYMCLSTNGFIKGFKNIKEPFGMCRKTTKKEIDAVVVPGIAFDKRGYRVGYGKGFYDKFLKEFKGIKIGVAFDCCITEKIDNEKHDVAVDYVVSEKRSIVCKLRR